MHKDHAPTNTGVTCTTGLQQVESRPGQQTEHGRSRDATHTMDEGTFDGLRRYCLSRFTCGTGSIHGPSHWGRVERMAVRLAHSTGANVVVVRLFAIFHDCCRADDGDDIDHGPRAAKLLRRHFGSTLPLNREGRQCLIYAVDHHTDGVTSTDPTIGTCWDADRLDLWRVGIKPSPAFMSTAAGQTLAASHAGIVSKQSMASLYGVADDRLTRIQARPSTETLDALRTRPYPRATGPSLKHSNGRWNSPGWPKPRTTASNSCATLYLPCIPRVQPDHPGNTICDIRLQ